MPSRSRDVDRRRARRRRRARLSAPGLLVVLAGLAGCGTAPAEDPLLRERVISFAAEPWTRLLAAAGQLEGTPLGRHAQALLPIADGCQELWAHLEDEATPEPSAFRCVDGNADDGAERASAPALARLVAERRGDADGLILWPIGEDGRLELRVRVGRRGGLTLDGWLRPPADPGGLALLLPGGQAPAPPVIAPGAPLVHLRARPAHGLRLSALVPVGGQADRLFALKGRLLEGALLAGTWELAFLPPTESGRVPLPVVALHHRTAEPIRLALDEALGKLEATWPISRTPLSFTTAGGQRLEGGCFAELPLLPELAPCWTVTPDALLVGYRGEAIDAALAAPAVSSAPTPTQDAEVARARTAAGAVLDVRLDRFAESDRARDVGGAAPDLGALYSRLELRLHSVEGGAVQLFATLRSGS